MHALPLGGRNREVGGTSVSKVLKYLPRITTNNDVNDKVDAVMLTIGRSAKSKLRVILLSEPLY